MHSVMEISWEHAFSWNRRYRHLKYLKQHVTVLELSKSLTCIKMYLFRFGLEHFFNESQNLT